MSGKLSNKFFEGTLVNFAVKVLSFAINYIIMFLIIKSLGIDYYGWFSTISAIIFILSALTILGLDIYIIKVLANIKQKKYIVNYILKSMLILIFSSSIFTLMYYFLKISFKIDSVFDLNDKVVILVILSMLHLFFVSVLRGLGSVFYYAIFEKLLIRFFTLLIIVATVSLSIKINPINLILIATIISLSFLIFIVFKMLLGFEKDNLENDDAYLEIKVTGIINEAKYFYISSVLIIALGWMDTVFLRYFHDTTVVGNYNAALQIAILINFALSSVNGVLSPIISKLFANNKLKELESLLFKVNVLILFASIITLLVIILLGEMLLNFIGVDNEIYPILIILSIGQLGPSFFGSIITLLNMTGNHVIAFKSLIITFFVAIVLNLIAVPTMGLYGAAIATSVSLLLRDALCTFLGKSKYRSGLIFFNI